MSDQVSIEGIVLFLSSNKENIFEKSSLSSCSCHLRCSWNKFISGVDVSVLLSVITDDHCCQFMFLCKQIELCLVFFPSIYRMLFIDTNFQTLKLKAEDSSGRQHVLNIKLKLKVRHSQELAATG